MPVTVGTDVYDTVANSDTYWAARGNTTWTGATEANKEVWLVKATDWLERNFRYRGVRKTSDQRLHFPADQAFDDDGYPVGEDAAPRQVKEAMFLVGDLVRQGTYDLDGIVTDDLAAVKRQKVDVIEVEYDTAHRLRGQDVLSHVYQLLAPVVANQAVLLRS